MKMYNKFIYGINETHMTHEKYHANLELNRHGKSLDPFEYYYTPDMDNNNYFVIKNIDYNEYHPQNNRVTLLTGSIFLDTDTDDYSRTAKRKLNNTNFNQDDYLFYKLVSTPRRFGDDTKTDEIHGVAVRYEDDPNRFSDQLTEDGKIHFIVIKKNDNVTSVRLNTNKRTFAGSGAEKTIANRFGWNRIGTKIKKNILKKVNNDYVLATLKDIMTVPEVYNDLFIVENPDENISKYDVIIPDGEYAGKKIEVKRYSASSLFEISKGIRPRKILLAEQLKIATKKDLRKIVELYGISTGTNVDNLLNMDDIRLSAEFSKSNYDNNLINNIRDYYNARMEYMIEKFNRIPQESIMSDIYGIYFFNLKSGQDGFLIKNYDGNVKNIDYVWDINIEHWGLKRIRLMFMVNPNSYRYIWLGDVRRFVKTYRVKNTRIRPSRFKGVIKTKKYGIIKWSHHDGYWVISNNDNDNNALQV